jgi:hypothetical protein
MPFLLCNLFIHQNASRPSPLSTHIRCLVSRMRLIAQSTSSWNQYVPADIASTSINQTLIAKQAHTFLVKTLWRRACDVVLVRRQAEKHASGCRETKKTKYHAHPIDPFNCDSSVVKNATQ